MKTEPNPVRTIITVAVTIVLVLGGLLGARLVLRWWQTSRLTLPPNTLPATPRDVQTADLEVPCWSCPSAKTWPVRFQTDLDLIAPLGDDGEVIGLDRFGASAPAPVLFEQFGFTADNVYARARAVLAKGA